MRRVRSFLLLAILAAALATKTDVPMVGTVLLPVAIALLAARLDREGNRLAVALVRSAAGLLPAEKRQDEEDVWMDHILTADEEGLSPLASALSIAFIAAPALAIGLRIGRRSQRARG